MYTNTRKRVALVVLGLIVASSTLIAQQYDFQVGQLYYKITDTVNRKVAVVPERFNIPYYSDKPIGAVAIPATVVNGSNTYSVTSIGVCAFYQCSGLTSISIPSSVTSIGEWAFSGCSGLTSIAIPSSVTKIEDGTFSGCSGLTSITIPNSITSVGYSVFSDCSGLTSITIPNSVTSIGYGAFYGCSRLTSIAIPVSCEASIATGALAGCTGLTSITIPSSVTSIGNGAFYGCSGLTSISIPSSVTSIGESAFSGCSRLTSIAIPNSITSIGKNAFSGCSGLTSITIPSSVTKIEGGTFSGCSGLTSISIPSSVTSIGRYAFFYCSGLTSITIPSSVTSIGESAFYGCSGLTSIAIPDSITSIKDSVFLDCSGLTSITIPSSVKSIGESAFSRCSGLTSINMPSSVKSIGQYTFFYCSGLTSITIPSSVTKIENGTFYNCTSLTSVNLPSGLDTIGSNNNNYYSGAFEGCTSLTTINIPNSVTSIGRRAFYGCSGLDSVIVHWQTPLRINISVFEGVTLNSVKLIVPAGKKSVYKTAPVWKDFNPIVGPSYTIVYNISVNGTFTVKDGSQEISSGIKLEYGTVLTIEARAAEHYKLDSILVNGTRISGLSFTVTGNTNIEVFFGKQSYTVTYNSNMYSGKIEVTRGSEIVASGSSVEYGTQLTVKAIPNPGFEVKSLTINDQAIVNNFVFSISEAVEIKAVFAPATTALDEAATEPLTLYPNPVADVLYLSATARTIRIYDMYGTEVAHAADTDKVEVSHLPAGVYTVRADGTVAKMVKR